MTGTGSNAYRPQMNTIAQRVMKGGPTLGKPTHFESLDGKF